ncbi:fidgetin-like protein 1 [Dendroctonus ponderosae]|uniref:Fidgetin-like protein 1 n=1 Tax=Dendroctonus ponderosae TaxID=77166 RepID=A0AAR5PBF8_DENPD|nr:fidgetin-like protein 1 [Dendroctonus ponderosae]KAH1022559.1 hypothetical protein HUJ04_011942 [Dendroctonus ponderosae]KAH1029060.1 hypothetical protein HUJ05_002360 [Dendroctonus ponderosae]
MDSLNVYEIANVQRENILLFLQGASEGLDNASACHLLNQKLAQYTSTVYKGGDNIYNKLLHEIRSKMDTEFTLRVPKHLKKLDLNAQITKLDCSEQGLHCAKSELISESELKQFADWFAAKQQPSILRKFTDNESNIIETPQVLQSKSQFSGAGRIANRKTDLSQFTTARHELENQKFARKVGTGLGQSYSDDNINTESRKKLGSRRTAKGKFVSPLLAHRESESKNEEKGSSTLVDDRLKNIDPKMVELITAEIMDKGPEVAWNDIAGLEFAKAAIQEAVVWPLLRPDIFTGLRKPPKGILLFGPPGTGKTLIGKCVASQSKSTFFSISASSLTSKWIGDGEKMVRALFVVARVHQPSVIFIDEVDSLLTQRSDTEHESSRRIKTEFLVQLDGATTDSEERLLVIGATNRPQELDEAARRRFVKRLYIPLPEHQARVDLLKQLMGSERHSLTDDQIEAIAQQSAGYSGADIKHLCSEAALEPIRSLDLSNIENIQASQVPSVSVTDFQKALSKVRASVCPNDLVQYLRWNETYGSGISFV